MNVPTMTTNCHTYCEIDKTFSPTILLVSFFENCLINYTPSFVI